MSGVTPFHLFVPCIAEMACPISLGGRLLVTNGEDGRNLPQDFPDIISKPQEQGELF